MFVAYVRRISRSENKNARKGIKTTSGRAERGNERERQKTKMPARALRRFKPTSLHAVVAKSENKNARKGIKTELGDFTVESQVTSENINARKGIKTR